MIIKLKQSEETRYSCKRCGTCCQKGGPSLHREDRPMVDDGRIPARCLFTIRRGELVRDNVKDTLAPLSKEIIKIKGQKDRWTCLFYDQTTCGCGIYDHRPLECRVLNCRDTRQIEDVYETARLTRQDLLSSIPGLWELIIAHEQHCSYEGLALLVGEGMHAGRLKQEKTIMEIIRYDTHVRQLTTQKAGMDERMLEFIYGRPLVDTIKMFDITLMKHADSYRLIPSPHLPKAE